MQWPYQAFFAFNNTHYKRILKVTQISNYFFSSLANTLVIICEKNPSAKENQSALSSFLSFLQMKSQILNYAGEGFGQQFQHHENESSQLAWLWSILSKISRVEQIISIFPLEGNLLLSDFESLKQWIAHDFKRITWKTEYLSKKGQQILSRP